MSSHADLSDPNAAAARAVWRNEAGQGLPEYALLLGAVAVLVVSCAMLFRTELSTAMNAVGVHVEAQAALLTGEGGGNGGGKGGGNGGSSAEAPGHGSTPPGQGGTPPGQGGANPGKGGKK